jgi:hypothetical protein
MHHTHRITQHVINFMIQIQAIRCLRVLQYADWRRGGKTERQLDLTTVLTVQRGIHKSKDDGQDMQSSLAEGDAPRLQLQVLGCKLRRNSDRSSSRN